MSAIWESANWTRQFGIRQTGNQQFGMLPHVYMQFILITKHKHMYINSRIIQTNKKKAVYPYLLN
jgi:hypothetical protein